MKTKEEIIHEYYGCSCDKIYTSRKMIDPSCVLHDAGPEIGLMMDEYARQTAIDYAHWLIKRMFPGNDFGETPQPEGERLFELHQQEAT